MDARLVMFRENGERRDFPMKSETTRIGRKVDCDIRIPLTEVSRHHAELRVQNDTVVLKDLGSANGTFVNNKRVKKAELSAGDHVVIGPVVFTVQINGQPEEIKPVKTKLKRRRAPGAQTGKEPAAASGSDLVSDDELDPISALEALASSADQTAIDPFEEEEL